ncbi:hypothetical protein P7C70_g3327, partial [Phenoliferia sp. Uapishka_3]
MFTAIIDSRKPFLPSTDHPPPPPEPDIGTFHALPDGSVLETGLMTNPLSSTPSVAVPYEEIWRRLPLTSPSPPCVFLRSNGPGGVAFVGRIGDCQLGICSAEREFYWFFARRLERKEGDWKEVYCVGGEAARVTLPEIPEHVGEKEGEEVALSNRVWIVLENSRA